MINPLRIAFLTLWLMTAYALIPFEIIEQTGSYMLALIEVVLMSIFVAIILEIKITECDTHQEENA